MASSSNTVIEGQSINRPSFFDEDNYNYWKCRIVIYLKSINYELWDIVINGFAQNQKSCKEWDEEEKRMASLDSKGLNILFCAVNQEQFHPARVRLTLRELNKGNGVHSYPVLADIKDSYLLIKVLPDKLEIVDYRHNIVSTSESWEVPFIDFSE